MNPKHTFYYYCCCITFLASQAFLQIACKHAQKSQTPKGEVIQNNTPSTAHNSDTLKTITPVTTNILGKDLRYANEKHLANVQQLTFGGDNAEAYFSFDSQYITFQRVNPKENIPCDQIFYGKLPKNPMETFNFSQVSTGKGRTTCSYFLPGNRSILYASTHLGSPDCPPPPDWRALKKYVWALYPTYEIFYADLKGNISQQLTKNKFYDAEATVSPDGKNVVFTSTRSGDLELWTMHTDGSNLEQITYQLGYDGGAFFSPDNKTIVFRASRPQTTEEIKEYKDLLAQDLVAPTNMEIYTCNTDGSNLKQITNLGGANWAPFFHPNGKKIIFCSNHKSVKKGYNFNLYSINLDGSGLEQITYDDTFDSFPMFSPNGKKLIFASNRNNNGGKDTNLFIADWVE